MFDKKDIEPEKQELTASCETCKHLVLKDDMKKIRVSGWLSIGGSVNKELLYCPEHKPKYDTIFSLGSKKSYYREMETDENGEPLGYVKSPDKKHV